LDLCSERRGQTVAYICYDREIREIITYVWGKRDLKTAKKLRKQLKELNITYASIATDDWKSFKTTFK